MPMKKKYNNKAIVIGTDNHNSLGIIRSLGKQGITVELIVITDDISKKTAIEYSKYVKASYRIKEADDELIPALLTVSGRDSAYKSIVFTTSDITAKLIDDNKELIKETCIVPGIMRKDIKLADLLNKYEVNRLAKESGLEVPSSMVLEMDSYQVELLDNIQYPCIVKPVCSIEGAKSDIKKLVNKQQLLSYIEILKQKYERVLIQEYIDGNDSTMVGIIGFVTLKGEICISGIMNKLREYPLKTGSTSYGLFSENIFNLDIDKIKDFIKRTGYRGIFDFDFKFANGKCYFLEVNFRNGALTYASTGAGVNLPYLWYLDACGYDITNLKKQVNAGLRFMLEIRDFRHVFNRDIKFIKWLKDLFSTNVFLVMDKNDIRPFIMKVLRIPKLIMHRL